MCGIVLFSKKADKFKNTFSIWWSRYWKDPTETKNSNYLHLGVSGQRWLTSLGDLSLFTYIYTYYLFLREKYIYIGGRLNSKNFLHAPLNTTCASNYSTFPPCIKNAYPMPSLSCSEILQWLSSGRINFTLGSKGWRSLADLYLASISSEPFYLL